MATQTTDNVERTFAIDIVRQLNQRDFIAYFAGGCVRDQMLGIVPSDYDVASNASPQQIIQIFGKQNTLLIGAAFGVASVHRKIAGRQVDVEVATFRSDGQYVDGRRPTSIRFSTPQEDAQRRDFTINGMFYDPLTQQLHDFVSGQTDLQNRLIRSIGDARQRIAEDKLRMVRAIRFAAKFGFAIEPETLAAITSCANELTAVSAERISDELHKIADLDRCSWALDQLHSTGLLRVAWPLLNQMWTADSALRSRTLQLIDGLPRRNFCLIIAAIGYRMLQADTTLRPRTLSLAIAAAMKLSNVELRRISFLLTHVTDILRADLLNWSVVQPLIIQTHADDCLTLASAITRENELSRSGIDFLQAKLQSSLEALDPPPLISGRDLTAAGLVPGPAFKAALEQVRRLQLDGELHDKQKAMDWVMEHFTK